MSPLITPGTRLQSFSSTSRTTQSGRNTQSGAAAKSMPFDIERSSLQDNRDRYPLPLKHIKALFLHEQYRHCVQACGELLLAEPDLKQQAPLHYAFVYFYLAMAHEETARLMDNRSHVKVTALNLAEQCYRDALSALPAAEAAHAFLLGQHSLPTQSLSDDEAARSQRSSSPIDDVTLESFPMPGSLTPRSDISPQPHIHDSDLPDFSDSESQGSFGDLMTATRVFDRDFSRRSLIATPTKQFHHARPRSFCGESGPGLPRTTSNMSVFHASPDQGLPRTISHSLLRPVRLGSPAKPYTQHLPGQPQPPTQRSRLPKPTSPLRLRPMSSVCETINEDEPISPLAPAELTSASTLSPVSSVSSFDSALFELSDRDQHVDYDFLSDLEALHMQLLTHLRILDTLRHEASEAQTRPASAKALEEQAAPAPLPVSQNRHTSTTARRTTDDQKNLLTDREDRQKRILAGRKRKWTRERFDPQRYVVLAERAMAEL